MLTILRSRISGGFVYDAIYGARLSKGSANLMDSVEFDDGIIIGPNDEAFIQRRIKAASHPGGRGEDKLLRAIPVSLLIRAPLRWWHEADTHRIPVPDGAAVSLAAMAVRQSSSLMHRRGRDGLFNADDFTSSTDARLITLANEKLVAWQAAGARAHSSSPEWVELQDAVGRGILYTSQWYVNMAILRNVYAQRHHHRMQEWRDLCAYLETGLEAGWMATYGLGDHTL